MNNTYGVHEVNPFCVRAVAEHRMLHASFAGIRKLLAEHEAAGNVDQTAFDEAVRRLAVLRDALAEHFRREEEGGYLEEAVGRKPALAHSADQLQEEHARLLVLAEELLADAGEARPLAESWPRLLEKYRTFDASLSRHEAAEDNLLQAAFNEDLGR
ncbi:MAG: hemerythrin domain-containing protein [Pirellulales bacterium]